MVEVFITATEILTNTVGEYAAAKPDGRASISGAQSERRELTPTPVLRLYTCAVVHTYKHTQTDIIIVKKGGGGWRDGSVVKSTGCSSKHGYLSLKHITAPTSRRGVWFAV